MTGFMEPYDVIFTQKGLTTLSVLPKQIQSDKSNGSIRHHLPVGSYMLSVAYDGPEMLELRKNAAETIATIPAGEKGQIRTVFVPRVAVTDVEETFYLVSTPAQSQADSDAKGVLSVYPNVLYDPDGGGFYPEPEPEPIKVVAQAPSWTDNSDGGGKWTTPEVEGIKYIPASGTASPGQTVTVTATALDGYVLLGATKWTHRFPVAPDPVDPDPVDPDPVDPDPVDPDPEDPDPVDPDPVDPDPEDPDPGEDDDPDSYSFTIRADTAPVNDRKQIYSLTAEQWAALSYLRDQTASHADPLGVLNVALRSDAAEIVGVTSVTDRVLVEDEGTQLGKVRWRWTENKYRTPAYDTFRVDIGPVIDEISTKGVLI